MSEAMWQRMKTAGAYQRKAIRALFPEKVNGHLDVIEQEIKMMVLELAADVVRDAGKADDCGRGKTAGAKKVEIG